MTENALVDVVQGLPNVAAVVREREAVAAAEMRGIALERDMDLQPAMSLSVRGRC